MKDDGRMQAQVTRAIQGAWRWSFGGLPDWLTSPGFLRQWSHHVHLEHLPNALKTLAELPLNTRADITLADEMCLKKELVLPAAARKTLDRVIDLNIKQSLPSGAADLIWRHKVRMERNGQVVVDVFLLKTHVLESVRAQAESHDVTVRRIGLADRRVPPFLDNRRVADRSRRIWLVLSLTGAPALLGYETLGEMQESRALQDELARLQSQRSDLAEAAVAKRQALDAENESFAAIAKDVDLWHAEAHRLPLLLDLTKALPDTVWISEFALQGTQLRLAGFAEGDVTDVLENVRQLPQVERVALNGTISFDSLSRRNRFELLVSLRSENGDSK